ADALCPSDTADHGKSQRCRLGHVISCVQSQLITWDMYTDHQGTDDQCALMISVAPEVPPVSPHQCHVPVPINATYQCIPVHINATYQCPSELPFNVTHQCQSVPPSVAYQCRLSVPVSAAYQCHLSVSCISAAFQCPSVMPVNAHQCNLPVPPHQCPSVPPISVHQC
ncbi:unnamed protein product, partial [Staurois parvus]